METHLQANSNSGLAVILPNRPLLAKLSEDFPKIKTIVDTSITDSLLNYLITLLNIKTENETQSKDLNIQMLVILDFVKDKFGFLTVEEIREAFKMYVAKELGFKEIYRNLDTIVVSDVLNAYVDFRNESLRGYQMKKQQLLTAKDNEKSAEEKSKIREDFLKVCFEEIKLNGFYQDAHHLYLDLENSGKIKISDFDKKIMYKQELEKYANTEKTSIKSKTGGVSILKELESFEQKLNNGKPISYVKNRCRSILVCEYLKKYLESFEDFKNSIE